MIERTGPITMNRDTMVSTISDTKEAWDILVIGGGATGLGAALDATTRKYRTLLLEKYDFAKGTSSKSTKLVHGGLRYLAQGNYALVHEALVERDLLLRNAPHLVNDQAFIIPFYSWSGGYYLNFGLKVYDLLSGKLKLMRSRMLRRNEVMDQIPGMKTERLKGGILYYDGQFDDAKLAINIAKGIVSQGGTVLNYFPVTGILKENNKVIGVRAIDSESGKEYEIKAHAVINATGVYVDDIIKMDDPENEGMVIPSQGVHVVVDRDVFEAEAALVIPKTRDGRVLFAVPWKNKVVIGTTDNMVERTSIEPVPTRQEVEFILETAKRYFKKTPTLKDIKSVFAGLRPLVARKSKNLKTKDISRRHKMIPSDSGLITITGGKWTTYRKMGEEVVSLAADMAGLEERKSETVTFSLDLDSSDSPDKEKVKVHQDLDFDENDIRYSAKHEMARKIEDFLARRDRALLLDARASGEAAPKVAKIMAEELNKDQSWIEKEIKDYLELANKYIID
ncbi:glycerol-3-phosphate dehydrogenase/oxidase [Bacteroidota bacterium]